MYVYTYLLRKDAEADEIPPDWGWPKVPRSDENWDTDTSYLFALIHRQSIKYTDTSYLINYRVSPVWLISAPRFWTSEGLTQAYF